MTLSLCLLLASCGDSDEGNSTPSTNNNSTENSTEQVPTGQDDLILDDSLDDSLFQQVDYSKMLGTMDPVVIHDGDGVYAEFIGFQEELDDLYMVFNVRNDNDQTYSLVVHDLILNGFTADAIEAPTLRTTTELTTETIRLDREILDHSNFEAFIDGSFYLRFTDSGALSNNSVKCDPISFATSNQGVVTQSLPDFGEYLGECNQAKIYFQGYEVLRGDTEPTLVFLIDNHSDEAIIMSQTSSADAPVFDGVSVDGGGAITILPNTWGILKVESAYLSDTPFPDSFSTCTVHLSYKVGNPVLDPFIALDAFELKG